MVFRERTYSVLLVSSSDKFNTTVTAMLPPSEYWPVHTAATAAKARGLLSEQDFDIVMINAPLSDESGTELAQRAGSGSHTCVLMLVKSELFESASSKLTEYGVMTLAKPTNAAMMSQALRALCAMREKARIIEDKQATLEEKMQEIRLVNRAKWTLIECLGMSEEEAQRYIVRRSQDLRISKSETAKSIIKTYN